MTDKQGNKIDIQSITIDALNKVLSELQALTKTQGERAEQGRKDTIHALRQQRDDRHAMTNTEKLFRLDKISKDQSIAYVRTELDNSNKEKVPYTPVTEDYAAAAILSLFQPFERTVMSIGIDHTTHALTGDATTITEAEEHIKTAGAVIFFSAAAARQKMRIAPEKYSVWLENDGIRDSTPRNERLFEDRVDSKIFWGFLARLTVEQKSVFIMSGANLRGVALVGAFVSRAIRTDGEMTREDEYPGFLTDVERGIIFGHEGEVAEDFAAVITGTFENQTCVVHEESVRIVALYNGSDLAPLRHNSTPPSHRATRGGEK